MQGVPSSNLGAPTNKIRGTRNTFSERNFTASKQPAGISFIKAEVLSETMLTPRSLNSPLPRSLQACRHSRKWIAVKLLLVLSASVAVFAQTPVLNPSDPDYAPCQGYSGPGGACYSGSGGGLYSSPGGGLYAGPDGGLYRGPGGGLYIGPGGGTYSGPGGGRYRGPGGGGACREIEPEAFARLVGWSMTLNALAQRLRCSKCGKKAAEVVAVARPRPRGVPEEPTLALEVSARLIQQRISRHAAARQASCS